MNHSQANPYAAPNAEPTASSDNPPDRQMLVLWIWLGVAVAISFLGTPADPVSMLIALAYGLISFWVGAILGSSLNMIARVISAVIWIIPAVVFALAGVASYFLTVGIGYLVISIVMGFWTWRRINNGRLRIILFFSAGYVLGSVLGPPGTVGGAVLGGILAKKSLAKTDGG